MPSFRVVFHQIQFHDYRLIFCFFWRNCFSMFAEVWELSIIFMFILTLQASCDHTSRQGKPRCCWSRDSSGKAVTTWSAVALRAVTRVPMRTDAVTQTLIGRSIRALLKKVFEFTVQLNRALSLLHSSHSSIIEPRCICGCRQHCWALKKNFWRLQNWRSDCQSHQSRLDRRPQ